MEPVTDLHRGLLRCEPWDSDQAALGAPVSRAEGEAAFCRL